MSTPEVAARELTYGEAVREAIAEEMRRDPRVFLIGEDVAEAGHPFKVLTGLVQEFGTKRIIDTPISEPGQHLEGDRKSTRLNSSHLVISYAVFCLKKKKKKQRQTTQSEQAYKTINDD